MARRVLGLAAVVALVAVVPLARSRDSFPLSTYPMFTDDRGRVTTVDTVVATDADGRRHVLSPQLVGGTDELVLAAVTVSRAIVAGRAHDLCQDVARRASGSGRAAREGWVRLHVVTQRLDTVDYLRGDVEPIDEWEHAACPLPA